MPDGRHTSFMRVLHHKKVQYFEFLTTEAHMSLETYDLCRRHYGFTSPAPSHKLQALDITVFSSLKTAYYSKCDRYMKLNPGRYQISHQFYVAYSRIATRVKQSAVLKQRGYILPSKPIVQQYQDKAEKKFAATKFQALAV